MKTTFKTGLFYIFLLGTFSVGALNAKDKIAPKACYIHSFSIDEEKGVIFNLVGKGKINVTLPDKNKDSNLIFMPEIKLNDSDASVSPLEIMPKDFSKHVEYTVTCKNEKGEKEHYTYVVHVKVKEHEKN